MTVKQNMTSREVFNILETADPLARVLLDTHKGARIEACRNRFANGFAIIILGQGGKYNVNGTCHYRGFDLPKAVQACKDYIDRHNLGLANN